MICRLNLTLVYHTQRDNYEQSFIVEVYYTMWHEPSIIGIAITYVVSMQLLQRSMHFKNGC